MFLVFFKNCKKWFRHLQTEAAGSMRHIRETFFRQTCTALYSIAFSGLPATETHELRNTVQLGDEDGGTCDPRI